MWRIWAKALGEKYGRTDREADSIAVIRTFIFISYLVTNLFIISGVIRHWNYGIRSELSTQGLSKHDQSNEEESNGTGGSPLGEKVSSVHCQ